MTAPSAPTPSPLPNDLRDLHQQAGAEFQPYADLEIVSTFGEPQAEYAVLHKSCGLMDLPQRGVLELTGKDRLSFLNNLVTNQTWDKETKRGMPPGTWVYAFFLNTKGRVVTDVNVIDLGERTLLELDARLAATLRDTLEKYRFGEQVKIESRVGALHEIGLYGPAAIALLNDATGGGAIGEGNAAVETTVFGHPAVAWRDNPTGRDGVNLIVPADSARAVWMNLLARHYSTTDPGKRRLRPVGWAAFNAARIEAGRPLFGVDFDDSVVPAETGQLARAVSFTKGCYLGQEVVARMHARGQVARQIVGLKLDDDSLPIAGAPVFDDQSNTIGAITSSTVSPVLSNVAICLGLVKRPHFAEGTKVKVPAEGAVRDATVAKLPFVAP